MPARIPLLDIFGQVPNSENRSWTPETYPMPEIMARNEEVDFYLALETIEVLPHFIIKFRDESHVINNDDPALAWSPSFSTWQGQN